MVEMTIRVPEGKKKEIMYKAVANIMEIKWKCVDYSIIPIGMRVILVGLLFWIIDTVIEIAYREGYMEGHHVGYDEGVGVNDKEGL